MWKIQTTVGSERSPFTQIGVCVWIELHFAQVMHTDIWFCDFFIFLIILANKCSVEAYALKNRCQTFT